jgi:hypothetical protein
MPDNPQPFGDGSFRHWLAGGITGLSVIGVVVLATVIIVHKPDEAIQILSTVLPVIGTWVGTVLAFYFSRANLEAATRSVTAIASQLTPDDRLRSKPAKNVMIALSQAFVARGPAANVKLLEAIAHLEQTGKGSRIPVLDENDHPLYIVHRSTIDRFISARARSAAPPDLSTLTLQDMMGNVQFKALLDNSFVTVNENATLANARAAMAAVPGCQDVFVTKAGTDREPILGWITNVIIEDNSKS